MNGRKPFSKKVIKDVFSKAKEIQNQSPNIWRLDIKNREICFPSYGDRNSKYGWDIHHVDGNKANNSSVNLIALHFDTHSEKHR